MSVCLVLFRIEVVEENPLLKSLEYSGPKDKLVPKENLQPPALQENLKVRRGLREPKKITVITLDEAAIAEEMEAYDFSSFACANNGIDEKSSTVDKDNSTAEEALSSMTNSHQTELPSQLNKNDDNTLPKGMPSLILEEKSIKKHSRLKVYNKLGAKNNPKTGSKDQMPTVETLSKRAKKNQRKALAKSNEAKGIDQDPVKGKKSESKNQGKPNDCTGKGKSNEVPKKENKQKSTAEGSTLKEIHEDTKVLEMTKDFTNNEIHHEEIIDKRLQNSESKDKSKDSAVIDKSVEDTAVIDKSKQVTAVIDKFEEDTAVTDKFEEDTAVIHKSEEDAAVIHKSEEDTSVIDKSEEDTAVIHKSEEDTAVIDKSVEDTTVIHKSEEDTAVIHKSEEDTAVIHKTVQDIAVIDKSVEDTALMHKSEEGTAVIHKSEEDPVVIHKSEEDTAVIHKSEEDTAVIDKSGEDTAEHRNFVTDKAINSDYGDMKYNSGHSTSEHTSASSEKNVGTSSSKNEVSVKEKTDKDQISTTPEGDFDGVSHTSFTEDGSTASGISHSVKESTPKPSGSKEGTPVTFKESLNFESGNTLVEVTKGIMHFYKQNSNTSLDENEERSEMLCMLAVPTIMDLRDLFQFTAACYSSIQHLRIVRDSNPNQYVVLLKFRSQDEADFFYKNYNGQRFNNINPDICNLVYVSRIETMYEMEAHLPVPGHTELPTCPVCLERMDESVDGILTILCNHAFHGNCLTKWEDTSCPVCRYCQVPDEVPLQGCTTCGATDSLWICLICGHVGCGRYVGGHAHTHFSETSHLFALQVGNNRVWDYVRDNYVHRLLQSEGDGKVVSFERENNSEDCKSLNAEGEDKMTALQLDYTYLFTTQMDSQREYFERKLSEFNLEAKNQADETLQEERKLTEELTRIRQTLEKTNQEKKTVETKLHQLKDKVQKLSKDLSAEKVLAKGILQNNINMAKQIQDLETTHKQDMTVIEDLRSQAADFMQHFAALNAVSENPEMEGGGISVPRPTKLRARRGRQGGR